MTSIIALLNEITRNPLVDVPTKIRAGFLLSRLSDRGLYHGLRYPRP
jgi:hypothetical protein